MPDDPRGPFMGIDDDGNPYFEFGGQKAEVDDKTNIQQTIKNLMVQQQLSKAPYKGVSYRKGKDGTPSLHSKNYHVPTDNKSDLRQIVSDLLATEQSGNPQGSVADKGYYKEYAGYKQYTIPTSRKSTKEKSERVTQKYIDSMFKGDPTPLTYLDPSYTVSDKRKADRKASEIQTDWNRKVVEHPSYEQIMEWLKTPKDERKAHGWMK